MTGPLIDNLTVTSSDGPKSKFLNDLDARYLGYHKGVQWWRLLSPLIYYSELVNTVITVPKNFVCDFASVRRIPLIWTLWGSKAHRSATIHDYLYREGTYGRKMADKIFKEAMQATDYRLWSRYPMFWGVRIGGWTAYNPTPGCLDYRFCEYNRNSTLCQICKNYKKNFKEV